MAERPGAAAQVGSRADSFLHEFMRPLDRLGQIQLQRQPAGNGGGKRAAGAMRMLRLDARVGPSRVATVRQDKRVRDLIAAGAFTTAGGVTAKRIARWDGTSWQPLGPINNTVICLSIYNGALIAGGGTDDSEGWFVQPTIIETQDADFPLLQGVIDGNSGVPSVVSTTSYLCGQDTTYNNISCIRPIQHNPTNRTS